MYWSFKKQGNSQSALELVLCVISQADSSPPSLLSITGVASRSSFTKIDGRSINIMISHYVTLIISCRRCISLAKYNEAAEGGPDQVDSFVVVVFFLLLLLAVVVWLCVADPSVSIVGCDVTRNGSGLNWIWTRSPSQSPTDWLTIEKLCFFHLPQLSGIMQISLW